MNVKKKIKYLSLKMKITGYVLSKFRLILNTNLETHLFYVFNVLWYVHTYVTHGSIKKKSRKEEQDAYLTRVS